MSDYVKQAAGIGDQYLAILAASQEQFLKSVEAFSTGKPAVPAAVSPFATGLPTPREVSEASFAFAAKLLKQQKEFTDKFLAAAQAS